MMMRLKLMMRLETGMAAALAATALSATLSAGQALAQPVELTLWHMEQPPHRVARVQEILDAFNAAHPEIVVTQEPQNWARSTPRRRPRSPPATARTCCSPSPISPRS
jgi:ABC-type glycerol-3-phosphate transport system substrate-binding protein